MWGKLTNCGLDTIAYVADPVEANRMMNVVKEHTRFTLESIKIKIAPQLLKYDSYDKENDRTATMMLLSSLEAEFQDTIQQLIDDSTPFPVVWMEIVHATCSVSIERFDQIALQIMKQHPRQGTLLGQFHHIQGGPGRYVHESFDVERPWEWRWWEVFVSEQEVAWSMNFVKKRLVSFVLPFARFPVPCVRS